MYATCELTLCVYFSQSVRSWYEICDVLVPILHSVKFTKYEICGSTVLKGTFQRSAFLLRS